MPLAELSDGETRCQVHYDMAGDGTPVLLLLPQSTGPAGRRELLDGLAGHHCVLTYDQRGNGRSPPAPDGLTIDTLAGDATDLLDALDWKQFHLVCHSTGCGIGQALCKQHPDRVRALVLAAPWTHADVHLHTMQTLRKAAARALDAEQYARFNAALLFPPEFRHADVAGFARQAAEAPKRPHDPLHVARYLDAILAFDARPLWPTINCPTLVMVAEDDQLMPPWFAAETARGISNCELIRVDGGGHMLPETRTGEFVAAVLAFLARVDTFSLQGN